MEWRKGLNISPLEADDRVPRPTAFLDRDGVINVDTAYAHRPEELRFTPTAIEAIALLNRSGYRVLVVTNQSGVARGMFGLTDVDRFHREMERRLAEGGARIDRFYVAPYHPDGTVEPFAREHPDRKPGAGMLLRAMSDFAVSRDRSFLIGDKDGDMAAAAAAGLRGVRVERDTCDLLAVARSLVETMGDPRAQS